MLKMNVLAAITEGFDLADSLSDESVNGLNSSVQRYGMETFVILYVDLKAMTIYKFTTNLKRS